MGPALEGELLRLSTAHRSGVRLVLLFGYDGTLTPLVERPALAWLGPDMRRLLSELSRLPGVVVGVISGRGLPDLRETVALPGLCYAGNCGLEMDMPGRQCSHPRAWASRPLIEAVAGRLDGLAAEHPGAWVEDKRLGLTFHYRQVAKDRLEGLKQKFNQVLHKDASRLQVTPGPMGWEVLPALQWNKGSALRLIVENSTQAVGASSGAPRPAIPLYAGDSDNDAEALDAATALGGVAVGIGPLAPTSALHRLAHPGALAALLGRLASQLSK